ncbi:hypothetical protein AO278_14860 [Pseudomonas syringae pv. syringae]|nr:hypothetical protein AO278_14860 [Pseudomonas syringae pv. syringae]
MARPAQRCRDATIAIPALVLVESCLNQVFQPGVFVICQQYLLLIVKSAACCRDATIAIPALVLVESCLNQVFQPGVFVICQQYLLLIVKSAACQTGKLQQAVQRM